MKSKPRIVRSLTAAIIIGALLCILTACDGGKPFDPVGAQQKLAALSGEANAAKERADAANAKVGELVAEVEKRKQLGDAKGAAELQEDIQDWQRRFEAAVLAFETLSDSADRYAQKIQHAKTNLDALGMGIETAAETVAPFLPAPWGPIVSFAVPTILGLIGTALKHRRAVRAEEDAAASASMAASYESIATEAEDAAASLASTVGATAINNGGVLDFNKRETREALSAGMTDDAKRVVREAGATVRPLTATPTPQTTE